MKLHVEWLAILLTVVQIQIVISGPTQSQVEKNRLFEEELKTIKEDRYPIQDAAGPVITDSEAEMCRKIKFEIFKVGSGIKYFTETKMRWRAASECCRLHGKVLMTELQSKNLPYYKIKVDDGDPSTDEHEHDAAWTSASNIINSRLYEWQSGEDFRSSWIWGPGEPNNKDPNGKPEGCGHLFLNGRDKEIYMNDWNCFQKNNFICEDQAREAWAGAEVNDKELDICRSLAKDFREYGSRYYHQEKETVRWKVADKCCKLHGLLLLSMDDETAEEVEILKENMSKSPHLTWTSGNDLEEVLQYKWQTGVSIYDVGNFSAEKPFCFFENYPQNYHPNRHCIQIRVYSNFTGKGEKDDGLRFRDVQCGLLRDFICERQRDPAKSLSRSTKGELLKATTERETEETTPPPHTTTSEPAKVTTTASEPEPMPAVTTTTTELTTTTSAPAVPIATELTSKPSSPVELTTTALAPVVPTTTAAAPTTANTLAPPKCLDPTVSLEIADRAVRVQSLNYGEGQYPAGLNCSYTFKAGSKCKLQLFCKEFDLRSPCTLDNFELTDGVREPRTKICTKYKVEDKSSSADKSLISSRSKSLVIMFRTDSSREFRRLYKGFSCFVKCRGLEIEVAKKRKSKKDGGRDETEGTTDNASGGSPISGLGLGTVMEATNTG